MTAVKWIMSLLSVSPAAITPEIEALTRRRAAAARLSRTIHDRSGSKALDIIDQRQAASSDASESTGVRDMRALMAKTLERGRRS